MLSFFRRRNRGSSSFPRRPPPPEPLYPLVSDAVIHQDYALDRSLASSGDDHLNTASVYSQSTGVSGIHQDHTAATGITPSYDVGMNSDVSMDHSGGGEDIRSGDDPRDEVSSLDWHLGNFMAGETSSPLSRLQNVATLNMATLDYTRTTGHDSYRNADGGLQRSDNSINSRGNLLYDRNARVDDGGTLGPATGHLKRPADTVDYLGRKASKLLTTDNGTKHDNHKEKATLRWVFADASYDQLVVEVNGPDGLMVVPVDYPKRRRPIGGSTITTNSQADGNSPFILDHLNSTSFTGSDLPQDQLYQLELDWITSRQEETNVECRLIGINRQWHGDDRSTLRPTTWTVVRRDDIQVDANLSSLDWISGGILGQGTHATVYLVYHKPAAKQACMKVTYMKCPLPVAVCDGIANELRVLEVLSQQMEPLPFLHRPKIIGSKWAWTSSEGFLHILTEFCPGGDLFDYAGKLSQDTLRYIIAELVVAIEALHSIGIVHHDIKPENILIDAQGHCVLSDFGGSKFLSESGTVSPHPSGQVVGTPPYAAPEVLQEDILEDYDESIDWWSLGATIFSLLTGEEYFLGETRSEIRDYIFRNVGNIRYTMELYDHCPKDLIDLVENLLQVEPSKRLRGPAIRKHRYFAGLPFSWTVIQHAQQIPGMIPPMPVARPVAAHRQGAKSTCKEWPTRFHADDPSLGYLITELRKEGLTLPTDNSCDVLVMHHQTTKT